MRDVAKRSTAKRDAFGGVRLWGIILALVLAVLLCAGGTQRKGTMTGSWVAQSNCLWDGHSSIETLEFHPDGTFVSDIGRAEGRYLCRDGEITLEGITTEPLVCEVRVSGDQLIFSREGAQLAVYRRAA